jgi:hypothetical protein
MRIFCQARKWANRWVVLAEWHRAERVVFESPSVFECCRWVARKEREDAAKAGRVLTEAGE